MVDTYSATIDRSGDRPGARNVDGVPNRSVRGPVYRGARNHCRRLLTDPGSRQRLEHHCRRNVRSNKRPSRRAGRDHWIFTFRICGPVHISDFIRIIFSWVGVSYANRLMRFLFRLTEPLLAPLRRTIPLMGMFDISPLVAFLIIWVCQSAVAATLLRGWGWGGF